MTNRSIYDKRYYEKHKKEIAEKSKLKYDNNEEFRKKVNSRNLKYRNKNRDKWKEYKKIYNDKLKEMRKPKIPCIECGSLESLVYHHIDPSTKIRKVSKMGIKDLQKEIDKCVILCRSCHGKIPKIEEPKLKIGGGDQPK